jgi:cytochrome c-type biogenesis protein CcmH/NrfF
VISQLAARATRVAISLLLCIGLREPHDASAQAPAASGREDSAAVRRSSADATLEERTRSVAAQLRCPVCQGLSLADSPSELALEMKDVVREQLAAGRTPDQVKAYFVAKYGEWILLEPPAHGINVVAYLLPGLALAAGLVVVWLALRRWTTRGVEEDAALSTEVD